MPLVSCDRLPIGSLGVIHSPECGVRDAQLAPCVRVLWGKGEGLLEEPDGLFGVAKRGPHRCEVHVERGLVGLTDEQVSIACLGARQVAVAMGAERCLKTLVVVHAARGVLALAGR